MRSTRPLWLVPLVIATAGCNRDGPSQPAAKDQAVSVEKATPDSPSDTVADVPSSRADDVDCSPADRGVITPTGVGAVRVGQSYAELREICPGNAIQMQTEVHRGAAYELGKGLHALLTDDEVSGILVETRGPATADGIAIGATVRDVRRAAGQLCAGIGATGVDIWQRGQAIVYSTTASPAVLTGDLARNRFEAGAAVPSDTTVERILVGKAPSCEPKPPAARWSDLDGEIQVLPLDEDLVTILVRAAGLAPGRYMLAIGPAAAEGLSLQPADYRTKAGRFDGRMAEPNGRGELRVEVTLPRRRFGPDQEGAVALRGDDGKAHMANFSLRADD